MRYIFIAQEKHRSIEGSTKGLQRSLYAPSKPILTALHISPKIIGFMNIDNHSLFVKIY